MDDEEEESRPSEPINPKQAEIDELNRRIDAALKSGRARKRRKADEDDVAIDESIANLRKRMRDAAYRDIDDNKDGLPAIHKMGMLTDVTDELRKTHLYEAFLENNIVDSLRLWLEPLDDGSLPALDIQNALLDILGKLPVRRDHLRESGIGKIIMFMSKCPRIPERNRRVCEQFVQRWSRMVMKLSSNFRDRKIRETKVNLDRRHFAGRPMQGNEETRRAPGGIQVQSGSGKDGERATARIPQRVAANYNVMPVSSVNASMEQMRGAGRDVDKYKRLKQTMYKGG
ncbi:Transcription factor iws1, partial [Linderina pennispora]